MYNVKQIGDKTMCIVEIGSFDKMEHETFGNCARIHLWKPSEKGTFAASVSDGVLYITRKMEDGDYKIVSVNSVFDLSIGY